MNTIPTSGFLRLRQILGDPLADPPLPAIIPIGRTSWWAGVKTGKYPKPVKLGPGTTCWKADDIRALIQRGNG
jgi:prophage regulatory protein